MGGIEYKAMEINKFVVYKGRKLPMVNTPLLKEEMLFLREKYSDGFLLHDIKQNRIRLVSDNAFYTKHTFDVGWKPVFGFIVGGYVVWNMYKAKKKVKEFKVKSIIPDMDSEYINNLGTWRMKEKTDSGEKKKARA